MEVNAVSSLALANAGQSIIPVRATSARTRSRNQGSGSAAHDLPAAKRIPIDLVAEKIAASLTRAMPDMDPEIAMEIAKRAVFTRDEAVEAAARKPRRSRYIEDHLGTRLDVNA